MSRAGGLSAVCMALRYLREGLSVIPTRPAEKTPLLARKEFQARRVTETEVVAWYARWPGAGVAVVCGHVSAVVVLDGDPRNGNGLAAVESRLPTTPTAETGGGGRHYYFRLRPGVHVEKVPALLPGLDLQAEGSYVVAPPSRHPSGQLYRWRSGLALGELPLAPLPAVVHDLLALHRQGSGSNRLVPRAAGPRGCALTVETALTRLDGVRRCGEGWRARCPVHHDREPSLSVGVGSEGNLLLYCHAGCPFADVLHALHEGVSA